MKRKGFTLIEMLIVILIIMTLSAVSMPVIIQSVIRIEKEASIESAALALRQFYIDARSKSLQSESAYHLTIFDDKKSMRFTEDASPISRTINFTIPSGIRSNVILEQSPEATYSYILGIFVKKENNRYIPVNTPYSMTININGEPEATVTIDKGYPKFEIMEGSGS